MTCCHMLTARKTFVMSVSVCVEYYEPAPFIPSVKRGPTEEKLNENGNVSARRARGCHISQSSAFPAVRHFSLGSFTYSNEPGFTLFISQCRNRFDVFLPKKLPRNRNRCVFGSAAVNAICGRRQELRAWNTPEFPLKIIFKNSILLNNDHLQSKKW